MVKSNRTKQKLDCSNSFKLHSSNKVVKTYLNILYIVNNTKPCGLVIVAKRI